MDICINYDVDDFLTSDQFKETDFFVIMFDDTRYCLSTDWINFMESEDNIISGWVKNPNHLGKIEKQRFHKISPGFTIYIDHPGFKIIKEKVDENQRKQKRKYCIFILGDRKKVRLGNTKSIYEIGQILEDVYSVDGCTTLDRKQLLEFKMKETTEYAFNDFPKYVKGMSSLTHLKGLDKNIYLFGEKHIGKSSCRKDYINIDEFIELLSENKKDITLDIFVEAPYVTDKGVFKPDYFTRDEISSGLDTIQFTYQDCLTGERECFIENLRFHYSDIRTISSPFYKFLFKLKQQQTDEDINKYLSILLRTGFDKVYNNELLLEQSKIIKQLSKIDNEELKEKIIEIIKRKLNETRPNFTIERVQTAIDNKKYEEFKKELSDEFLMYFVVIFDGYVVARMMKDYAKHNYVFTGDLHRRGIRDILLELGFTIEKEFEDDMYNQCLPISDFTF